MLRGCLLPRSGLRNNLFVRPRRAAPQALRGGPVREGGGGARADAVGGGAAAVGGPYLPAGSPPGFGGGSNARPLAAARCAAFAAEGIRSRGAARIGRLLASIARAAAAAVGHAAARDGGASGFGDRAHGCCSSRTHGSRAADEGGRGGHSLRASTTRAASTVGAGGVGARWRGVRAGACMHGVMHSRECFTELRLRRRGGLAALAGCRRKVLQSGALPAGSASIGRDTAALPDQARFRRRAAKCFNRARSAACGVALLPSRGCRGARGTGCDGRRVGNRVCELGRNHSTPCGSLSELAAPILRIGLFCNSWLDCRRVRRLAQGAARRACW